MEQVKIIFEFYKNTLNDTFSNKEPWKIATITTTTVLLATWFYDYVFNQEESFYERQKKVVFRLVKKIPKVKNKIEKETLMVREMFEKSMAERVKGIEYITNLPKNSLDPKEIHEILDKNLTLAEYAWHNGRVSGAVYYNQPHIKKLVMDVYGKTSYTNPLHVDIFPGVCKMETEIVRMVANLFHGGENALGSVTTGGTESILLACKAWRDYMRDVKGITKPEAVLPRTAHSAFDKAAQYFRIKIRYIPCDPTTWTVDIKAMEKAINKNTVMLAGSAPNFPYGTADDIKAIAELGIKYNIPVHVDSCLGGFLTAFMEEAGYDIPILDFRLPGVTSISVDTHKYGLTPKGSSVVLYRDRKYMHYQYTTTTDWPGGTYGSPTINGSRCGGNIAVTWATMLHIGRDKYVEYADKIIQTSRYIEQELRKIHGIFVFGRPLSSVVAIGSEYFDALKLASFLFKRGWNLNTLQYPSGLHIAVTHLHTQEGVADSLIKDIQELVAEIGRAHV